MSFYIGIPGSCTKMRTVADRRFERLFASCQGLRDTCSLQSIGFGGKRSAWMDVAINLLIGLPDPGGLKSRSLSDLVME